MIATILTALGNRLWWIVGAVVILGGGYVYVRILQAELDAATSRATLAEAGQATAVKAADTNAKAIATLRTEAARDTKALTEERDAAVARATEYATLQGDISHAPTQTLCQPGNDDVVAAVLDRTLDSLRRQPATANGGH